MDSEVERNRIASDLHDGGYRTRPASRPLAGCGSRGVDPVRLGDGRARRWWPPTTPGPRSAHCVRYSSRSTRPICEMPGWRTCWTGCLHFRGAGDGGPSINPDPTLPSRSRHCSSGRPGGLRNVVTHAHATEVNCVVAEAHGRATLTVEDNGVGVPPTLGRKPEEGHMGCDCSPTCGLEQAVTDVEREPGRPGSIADHTLPSVGTRDPALGRSHQVIRSGLTTLLEPGRVTSGGMPKCRPARRRPMPPRPAAGCR